MKLSSGKLLAAAAIAVVALAVVAGALSVADPFTQRRIRFDERRVSDLDELQDLVGCYWRDRGQLPSDSGQFAAWADSRARTSSGRDYRCDREPRADPATNSPYGYRLLSDSRFELCATFFEESHGEVPGTAIIPASYSASMVRLGNPTATNWKHPAGEHCFRFEVRAQGGPDIGPVIGPLPEA